jgi:heme exporter protein A
VDIVLAPGSALAITGLNGCGKSTLLRALRGLAPARGLITVDGRPAAGVEATAPWIGYVGQQAAGLVLAPTVLAHAAATVHGPGADALAMAALHHAGLADRATSHPADMSSGQRQRLALVSATLHGPPVWLLDEPTRALDAVARAWLIGRIASHLARGGAAVIATHDRWLVEAVCSTELALGSDARPAAIAVDRVHEAGVRTRRDRPQHAPSRPTEVGVP